MPTEAPGLSVLLIADDQALADLLAMEGFDVTSLDDQTTALVRLRDEMFHLVVLDLSIVSRVDLLPRIREVDDDIGVIVLTAHPSLETATESITHEVSAYLTRPFAPNELLEAIGQLAEKKGLVRHPGEDQLLEKIGHRIRDLRKTRGLTLQVVAHRPSMSVSLLSQLERAASSPSVSTLLKVAIALDVPMTYFFGETR